MSLQLVQHSYRYREVDRGPEEEEQDRDAQGVGDGAALDDDAEPQHVRDGVPVELTSR